MTPEHIKATEQKAVEFSNEHNKWLISQKPNFKNEKLLGLHTTPKGIAPGNFVGAVWIGEVENQTPLIVISKFPVMDYMSMYLACAEDPIVRRYLNNCFSFWPEETPIKANELPKLSELVIAAFLRELNELCTRHLRRHFERKTNNLRGKVKGKILLHLQVKQNLARGRQDRVFCSYQTINDDIPENRVLRAALEQSAKFINTRHDAQPVLNRWIHANRSALASVPVVDIKRTDFRNLRVRGSFSHYRQAVNLAKFVLLRLGTNPHAFLKEDASTPPFSINSAELFERYAEKMLREKYPGLQAGYEKKNTSGDSEGFNTTVRPDFWMQRNEIRIASIIDAKYKPSDGENPNREDTFQMVAYSRHKNLLKRKLNCENTDNIELALVYPDFEQIETIKELKTDNSFFTPLKMWKIKCPTIAQSLEKT